MPKVHNTRRQRARELLKDLQEGPSWSLFERVGEHFTREKATEEFKLWSNTWIIPKIKELIPELRQKKNVII